MALIPFSKVATPIASAIALAGLAYSATPIYSRPISETTVGWAQSEARYRMSVPRQGSDKPGETNPTGRGYFERWASR